MNQLDTDYLETLRCPISGGSLRLDAEAQQLVCDAAGTAYPIEDGILALLPEAVIRRAQESA